MKFTPAHRLTRAREIRAVREQGRKLDCRAFTLWWKPRATDQAAGTGPRVCVIASTAAVGRATHRNRAKRRLREIFRHEQAGAPAGCDLLMIARPGTLSWSLPRLEETFREACGRITAGEPKS